MSVAGGIQAMLLGGRADGCAVRLHELQRELVVFVNGSVSLEPPEVGSDNSAHAVKYQLVEPVGPEMPVYVTA